MPKRERRRRLATGCEASAKVAGKEKQHEFYLHILMPDRQKPLPAIRYRRNSLTEIISKVMSVAVASVSPDRALVVRSRFP